MEIIKRLNKMYELKSVYRFTSVGDRKESTAEHSWSSIMLADYFMTTLGIKVDRVKVYELIMYHDLAEIETWDIWANDFEWRKNKKELELKAMKKLSDEIPVVLKDKYIELYNEFEEKATLEAKFANAVEKIDAEIQCIFVKKDWEWWDEEMVENIKWIHYKEFPEIYDLCKKMINYCKENKYF